MARRKPERFEAITPPDLPVAAIEPAQSTDGGSSAGGGPPLPTARPLPKAIPLPRQPGPRPQREVPGGAPARSQPPPPVPGSAAQHGKGQLTIDAPEPDPLEPQDLAAAAIRTAPAWLISFVLHTLILIVLSWIVISRDLPSIISLDATYADTLGAQLEDDSLDAPMDMMGGETPSFSLGPAPALDPLASPPMIDPMQGGLLPTARLETAAIGSALTGREAGMKRGLLVKYGGTQVTEAAVQRALEWLKRNQRRDGSWSLQGPYSNPGMTDAKVAATAMALIAFQGAGNTTERGDFQEQVLNGWRALLKEQDQDGCFYHGGQDQDRPYSQGLAMIAVCEIYGMTKSSMFRAPAQKAVDYAVKIQSPEGGWRYLPGVDSDTSVTGWFVMGLQSALMAGLDVPSLTFHRVDKFLDTVALDGGSLYRYQPIRQGYSLAMTAEGLLCRQYLGWKQDDPRLLRGAQLLLDNGIDWNETRDVYYWYYATQVLHHLEGDYWEQWNNVMREEMPKRQVQQGREAGSWDPDGDRWGAYGGRLYTTCLSTYMLEVYYRHLAIYSYRTE